MTGEERRRIIPLAMRAALASVAMATSLLLLKGYGAWHTGSVAMLGSLADTALDLLASLVTLYGVKLAAEPADHDHRFGHGKAEALAALFQVALITASAAAIAWRAIAALRNPEPTHDAGLGITVSVLAIAATLLLLWYQRHIIRRTGSVAIMADNLHYQSDALLNGSVIVALVLDQLVGWSWADPVLGIVIALWLAWGAFQASSQAIDQLMDKEWPEDQRAAYIEVAARSPGIRGIHDFRTRRSGSHDFAQFHMEVAADLTVAAAHEIVVNVEQRLRDAFPKVEVLIHLDPEGYVDTDNPLVEADVTPHWFGKRI
ncbi:MULTISPECIES: cation diffusion facilitator family transporter [Sphingomonas]|uniref:Cation diffusion facilitator family transporter n=1 Tax=Sphingomonas lycopersici TaxID=2951807 RepID=A0AA41ZDM1_9SPHN|nr:MULTISPECIES: cation diffusion facilitator family transporter [Sphingomonas]MCW6531073.1 cation diffusion facilitator family transporter [Sphingomonas lycopersici]MCW6534686.1 cation diffusion facilitator family transporter [Sphingomonas lycopersici]OJU16280.1 MAG: divalent metal cation transporter FieF [Sphingomonas sp. 66-10]